MWIRDTWVGPGTIAWGVFFFACGVVAHHPSFLGGLLSGVLTFLVWGALTFRIRRYRQERGEDGVVREVEIKKPKKKATIWTWLAWAGLLAFPVLLAGTMLVGFLSTLLRGK